MRPEQLLEAVDAAIRDEIAKEVASAISDAQLKIQKNIQDITTRVSLRVFDDISMECFGRHELRITIHTDK